MRRFAPFRLVALFLATGLLAAGCQDSSLTGPSPTSSTATPSAKAGGPGGGPGASSACTATVGSDVQSTLTGAAEGDVVCLQPGTYEESVTISVANVTLRSTDSGTATLEGQSSAAVTVDADGVTVKDLTVTNPDRLIGIKVERDVDGATIENNTIEDIGPTGRLGVSGIVVGQGNHDGVEITNNVIQDLDQETTEESGFPTLNGILFDAANDDPGTITNVAVNNNTIRRLESDVAPLGIVIQQSTDGVDINKNRIRDLTAADDTDSDPSDPVDFDFTFAQGINIASPSTANTVVNRNVIEEITSAEDILPEAVKIDGDGGGVKFRANQFLVAIGINNRNGTDGGSRDPSGDPVVDAKNNWWGSPQGPEEAAFNQDADDDGRSDVVGRVNADPSLPNPPGGPGSAPQTPRGNGPGNSPGNGPGNGSGNGSGGNPGGGPGNS